MFLFSIILALGSVFGLLWLLLWPSGGKVKATVRIHAGISALIGAFMGARLAYAAANWPYFRAHPFEIFQPWLGGLSWVGALAGGLLALGLAAVFLDVRFDFLLDDLLPLLISLAMATWLGCWLVGCAYGAESNLGLPTRDEWGFWQKRVPLQLMAVFGVIWLFWGIEQMRARRWFAIPGLAASFGVGGLSLILLAASLFRADPYPLYNGIRLETWAAIVFFWVSIISGAAIIFLGRGRSQK